MHVRFISMFDLLFRFKAQKESYHLNSTDNTASLPLSLECDGKANKINNTPFVPLFGACTLSSIFKVLLCMYPLFCM